MHVFLDYTFSHMIMFMFFFAEEISVIFLVVFFFPKLVRTTHTQTTGFSHFSKRRWLLLIFHLHIQIYRRNKSGWFEVLLGIVYPALLGGSEVSVSDSSWWLRVRSPVEANFLSGVFSPPTSAETCEKSNWWLWKENLC